jgi:hypothetical protein
VPLADALRRLVRAHRVNKAEHEQVEPLGRLVVVALPRRQAGQATDLLGRRRGEPAPPVQVRVGLDQPPVRPHQEVPDAPPAGHPIGRSVRFRT